MGRGFQCSLDGGNPLAIPNNHRTRCSNSRSHLSNHKKDQAMKKGFGFDQLKDLPEGKLRVLVCGDRKWKDHTMIFSYLYEHINRIGMIIQGEAKGADTMAKEAAIKLGLPFKGFEANWWVEGKAAGPRRNTRMLREGKPDAIIAFHDNIETSRGTADMIKQSRKAGIPCILISHEGITGDVEL